MSLSVFASRTGQVSKLQLRRLDQFYRDRVQAGTRSGYVYEIYQGENIVHRAAIGYADFESRQPMKDGTQFRLASLTKLVISVLILQLVEEGKVNLLDPLEKFFPSGAQAQVAVSQTDEGEIITEPAKEPIRVFNLLNHTAGLGASGHPNYPAAAAHMSFYPSFFTQPSLEAAANAILELPLTFHPGTAWGYSFSVDVLARIVEIVEAQPLENVLKVRICEQLGLKTLRFNLVGVDHSRTATAYSHDAKGALVRATIDHMDTLQFPMGGGGLMSTVSDFGMIVRALMNRGTLAKVRLLSLASVDALRRNTLPEALQPISLELRMFDSGFGLGVGVMGSRPGNPSLLAPGDYFWAGATDTFFFVSPSRNIGGVICAQYWPGEHTREWSTMYAFANMVSAAAVL